MPRLHAFRENHLSSCEDNVRMLNSEISNLYISSLQKNSALQTQENSYTKYTQLQDRFHVKRKLKLFFTEHFVTKCIITSAEDRKLPTEQIH